MKICIKSIINNHVNLSEFQTIDLENINKYFALKNLN